MKWAQYTVIVSLFMSYGSGARILGIFPMTVHSHFTLGFRIMKELADKGHEVYYINPYPTKEKVNNLIYLRVKSLLDIMNKDYKKNLFKFGDMTYFEQLGFTRKVGVLLVEETLKDEGVQQLLNSDKQFDLVLLENFFTEALSIFAHKFKCPLVLLAPGPANVYSNYLFANPSPSSYVPNFQSGFVAPLNFWERTQNLFLNFLGEIYTQIISLPEQNAILKKYVKDAPEIYDLLYNASLLLLVSHVSLYEPMPLQPNIKEIGGYHVSNPKPLPSNIQKYLDEAEHGVVLFSMGSNIRAADFPKEKREAVLKSFGRLKQKVLWKFEDDLLEKPDNVKIMKWLPQSDILAHPNVKVFIGHGGLLSTTEAIYHGVPIIGVPVFFDQKINIKNAESKGFAISIPFAELTEEKFFNALSDVLNKPSYSENAKLRSMIMHADPMKQSDAAVFWIEYVIKFNGAPHLRSAGLDLFWYQRMYLDILCVFGMIVLVICYLVKRMFVARRTTHKLKKL